MAYPRDCARQMAADCLAWRYEDSSPSLLTNTEHPAQMCSLCTGFVDAVGHLEAEDSPVMKLTKRDPTVGSLVLLYPRVC